MSLNAATLGALIKSKILATGDPSFSDNVAMARLCNAIADAVVTHVVAAGVVTVAPGIPVSTAGTALAQTGATTAPGTGAIS